MAKEKKLDEMTENELSNYWHNLVNKHLVGRKIVKVEWLSPKETKKLFGWSFQPCEIHLDNGVVLTPSADD